MSQASAMLRWLGEQEDPRTVGLFRIVFGVLLIADVATLWPHAAYLYGDEGVMPAATACSDGMRSISLLCHATGTGAARLVLAAFFVSATAFTIGLYTRVTKWITAYLFLSIVLRSGIVLAGEQVFGNFLFLLCLSRCDEAYSVDAHLRRAPMLRRIPAWPRRLMILQLCLAYGVAGWAKTGATWVEGTAFYYLLANDRWVRFEPWWLLATFGTNLLRAASWGAWWFERLFPLVALGLAFGHRVPALRIVGSRFIWASLSIVFTGSLSILANIGWFVPATMAATLVLFRGEEIGRVLRSKRVVAPPSEPAVLRWRTRLLAAFIAWHALAMIVNALRLPRWQRPLPEVARSTVETWGRVTNTWQFWGMFSPDVKKRRIWLIVDVVAHDGSITPAFDDRTLIGQRQTPYLFIDRRQKAHAKVYDPRHDYLEAYAQYVCRTQVDPREVVVSTWTWPLPRPRWLAAQGPIDPRPHGEPYRRDRVLLRWPCE